MASNTLTRLLNLEREFFKPSPIHILTKSYLPQPAIDRNFALYQEQRTKDGYVPKQGWAKLRAEFLAPDIRMDDMVFVEFDIINKAGTQPIIRALTTHDLVVI